MMVRAHHSCVVALTTAVGLLRLVIMLVVRCAVGVARGLNPSSATRQIILQVVIRCASVCVQGRSFSKCLLQVGWCKCVLYGTTPHLWVLLPRIRFGSDSVMVPLPVGFRWCVAWMVALVAAVPGIFDAQYENICC